MLGCQDFCGYYDWTFHYLHRRFGKDAVRKFWVEAVAFDAQRHYTTAGQDRGLKGLYDTWVKTGEDEQCDWTFTLDEEKNVLRMDMRRCPSKGFLLGNDLNADEDYCDHCIGWIDPALKKIGAEVSAHAHNHCGQCWWEMRMTGRQHQTLDTDIDIRKDERWGAGYIDEWREGVRLPILPELSTTDPCNALYEWYSGNEKLSVLGRGPSATDGWITNRLGDAVIVTDTTYSMRDVYRGEPRGVLIGDRPKDLQSVCERFNTTEPEQRPLLMHAYLPGNPMVDFVGFGLPRPVPVLPLLIRSGLYHHRPGQPYPTTGVFALMTAAALNKPVSVAGIDLYRHPSGRIYPEQQDEAESFNWPKRHSEQCDMAHILRVSEYISAEVEFHPVLLSMFGYRS